MKDFASFTFRAARAACKFVPDKFVMTRKFFSTQQSAFRISRLCESLDAGLGPPHYQGVDVLGAFIGINHFQILRMPHDRKLI